MRRFVYLVLCGACGGDGTPREPLVDAPLDASIDSPPPDVMPHTPATIFESATMRPGPFEPLPAQSTSGEQLLGVRFTTTKPYTVTGIGAHAYTICFSCTGESQTVQFMAIVPIDPATNLPTTTDLMRDAVGFGVAAIPYVTSTETQDAAPPSTVFPADFVLPAGTWGLVIGGGYYDTLLEDILLSTDVVPVGDPQYFRYTFEDQQWWPGQVTGPDKRFFVIGY